VIPDPWEFALIALAGFSIWKLLGDDAILDRPRDWVLDRIDTKRGSTKWEYFITCPWCAGAWEVLLVYLGWMATVGQFPDSVGDVAVAAGVWFALRAVVGYLGVVIDALEE
jgi:hypothetical protein